MTSAVAISATHSTQTLLGPSCLLLCTNKRLRDCDKKDPAWATQLAAKRTALLRTGFVWTRIRFLSRAWDCVQRTAVLGLSAAATQEHVLQAGGQSLTITAHFHRRKRNKCHISFDLHMRDPARTGLCASSGHMHVDLPKAYATKPEKRTLKQQEEMRRWMRDRSSDLDNEFASLHHQFVQVGRRTFVFW
jgi:hypothetical protein